MKRQPFRPKKGSSWAMAPHNIEDMPKLAELIGRITINWSGVDLHLALVLGSMLGVENGSSVAVFTALRQHRTQRDALRAAANGSLEPSELEQFEALMVLHERLDKSRNSAVHGIWGTAEEAPDGIIWSSIEGHALTLIREYHLETRDQLEGRSERLIEEMSVVKFDDLEKLNQEVMVLARMAGSFHGYLRYRGQLAGENAMKDLAQNPAMVEALEIVRNRKKQRAHTIRGS